MTRELQEGDWNEALNYELYLLDHVCDFSFPFSKTFNFSLDQGFLKQSVRDEIMTVLSSTPSNSTGKNKEIVEVLRRVSFLQNTRDHYGNSF